MMWKNDCKMNSHLYQISEEMFTKKILPIIEKHTKPLVGRPPKISHYKCFGAMLKMLQISVPWRDCPKEYGSWHSIYTLQKVE